MKSIFLDCEYKTAFLDDKFHPDFSQMVEEENRIILENIISRLHERDKIIEYSRYVDIVNLKVKLQRIIKLISLLKKI